MQPLMITGSAHHPQTVCYALWISVAVAVVVKSPPPRALAGHYFMGDFFMGIIILDSMC